MMEKRTDPLPAIFVPYAEFFDEDMGAKVPGSISVSDEDGRWLYGCPCGCGTAGALRVAAGEKPAQSPSWLWNGSTEKPTLTPSVHHVGHWHGWLTEGVWLSC
ncbi:hypothetical protein ASD80_06100 [Devosia sp. Root635]|nr:hypothetical protein ASD80_06100 [Devosia sp. Root635]